MFKPFITKLSGVTFNGRQKNIKKWVCADIGTYALVREPDMDADIKFRAEFLRVNTFPEITDTVGLTVRIFEIID